MFGISAIKTKELENLRTEIKGYYEQSEEVNEYFKIIASQLRGLEMGKLSSITRNQIKEAYETIAPVMGVVNYIADAVGDVSRYLDLRDTATGDYINKHWMLDLIHRPNDRYTTRKFVQSWAINRLLFGDAFVYAPKTAGKDRRINSMYIIPSYRVEIEKGGYDKPFKGIRITNGSTGEIELTDKVFESFDYNLDDTSFYGTSKIAAAATYLAVMDRAMNRQATSLKNGGAATIISPAANSASPALPKQLDEMEQKLNGENARNRNITTKLALEVHQLGDNPVNLSILESHKDAINVLCFIFKLPVDVYLGQSKYENAKEAKKTLYEQIAIPMANEFAEDLMHYAGLDDVANHLELKVDTDKIDVLKANSGETLDNLTKMHATLNEMRESYGYDPIDEDWANKPMIPMGVQFGNESFDFSEE